MFEVSYISAFIGGILTFLAPCTLPLIPAYIGFLSGGIFLEKDLRETRYKILRNSLLFISGFTAVFIFFGLISGSVGKFFILYRAQFAQIGGLFIVLFGLSMLGIFSLKGFFPFRLKLPTFLVPGTPFSSFLLGLLFALGWSPCLGPILGTILVLASGQGTLFYGGTLLAMYALGLAIPFFLVGLFYQRAITSIHAMARYLPLINKIAGMMLVLIGLLLMTNKFGLLNEILGLNNSESFYGSLVEYM